MGNKFKFIKTNLQTFAPLNYAEMYQQALQQVFTSELRFTELYNSPVNAQARFVNAKTVQMPTITVGGFVDVNRDSTGSYTRRADNQWTTYTLEHDREFRTLVDPVDIDETNMAVSIANITRVFNTEHKIPEMDKYMASKLYAEMVAAGVTANTEVATAANVLAMFDKAMEDFDEAEVPLEGRIMYATPAFITLVKNAEKLAHSIDVRNGGTGVNRTVHSLDSVVMKPVPSSRMKTLYDFTDGAVPAVGASQINMILIHPSIMFAPQKYETVLLDPPSATTGGKWLYYERKYWDVFLIPQKKAGIFMNVTAPSGS